jgi:hypothetical protein
VIRLTVLYNLPPGQDEDAFLEWRLGEHQEANMALEGVVASEFHRVLKQERGGGGGYRFMTTVDWPDRESFERGFYDPGVQAKLEKDLERVSDPVMFVSECLVRERSETGG